MDEVIAFLRDFIASDYEARLASYQPDRAMHDEKRRKAESFLDPETGAISLGLAFAWVDEKDDPEGANAIPQIIARKQPSILFLVRRYNHPVFGDLHRAYIDRGERARSTGYLWSLYVARTPRGLKIIARHGKCLTCRGSGQLDGEPCYQCGGAGWNDLGGEAIGDPGPVVEVRRLEAPTDPQSLADYERD